MGPCHPQVSRLSGEKKNLEAALEAMEEEAELRASETRVLHAALAIKAAELSSGEGYEGVVRCVVRGLPA